MRQRDFPELNWCAWSSSCRKVTLSCGATAFDAEVAPVTKDCFRCSRERLEECGKKVGRAGLEPATKCLKGACSTIELTTLNVEISKKKHQQFVGKDSGSVLAPQ